MDTDKNWIKRMPNCTGAATPSSGLFSDIYKRFYTFIYRANDVIDNIGQVPDMSTGEKQRLSPNVNSCVHLLICA